MTEVLNFYLQKYGLLEPKLEDRKIKSNEKAKQRWDLLRRSIRSVSALVDKDDLKNNKISHGIQFLRRISNDYEIEQASYLVETDSYITLDGHSIRIFDSSGKYKQSLPYEEIEAPFSRLQWANLSKRFIAWSPGTSDLAMLDDTFKVVEIVANILTDDPIFQLSYNEDKNELISSHYNKIITWQFRYANKHIMPKIYIPLNLKESISTIFDLERTQSKDQRLFVANDCGIITIGITAGVVTNEHHNMHERPITALVFFNPLKLLVTGCKDGSIKVWCPNNTEMDLRMVFVGHTAPVTALALFPGGCQAMVASSGNDRTLRVWSLEINDEIECIELDYSPAFIGSQLSKISFFTVDGNFVDIWQQNHVLEDLVSLSSVALRLDLSTDESQINVIVSCKNNLIFVASPDRDCAVVTKTVLSVQHIMDMDKKEKLKIFSTILLEETQTLFVLTNRNFILQYNTRSHPMSLRRKSQCSIDDNILILTLYKHTTNKGSKRKDSSLLITGTSNGTILVHDINEPETIVFKLEAHPGTPIISLISNVSNRRLFSAGHDNSIKVWSVYPFAAEPFARNVSFFCGHLPMHLCSLDNYLFTVFHDVDGAQYPIVIYNIEDRSRHDHSPNDDHIEAINSVSAARKMKLFLSSSAGTENIIKIWTCKNVLLRQIEVHFPLNCSIFSSAKADIWVSVGNQICKISHSNYLPRAYIKKQVLMHFEEPDSEKMPPKMEFNNEESQKMFNSKERVMLEGIKSVFRFHNYEDILPELEAQEVAQRKDMIEKSYGKIKSIEDDIRRLQLGQCNKSPQKYEKFIEKPKEADILKAYLSEFMTFYKISLPEDMAEDSLDAKRNKKPQKYTECEKSGFFPAYKSINMKIAAACTTINPAGYIPNSSVVNKLWPSEFIRDKADTWKPPMLSTLDLALARIKGVNEVEEETPRFFDWESDEEPDVIMSPISTKKESTELSEDLLSKFSSILQPSDAKEETEISIREPEPVKESTKRPVSTKITRETLKLPTISRTPATMPELRKVKFQSPSPLQTDVRKDEEILPVTGSEISSRADSSFFITQSHTVEHLKPVSVLPIFLLRFAEEKWFLRLCPLPHDNENCIANLLKPLTATNFCKQLIQLIKSNSNVDDLVSFVGAIQQLYSGDDIEKATVFNIHSSLTNKMNELTELDNDKNISLLKLGLKVMVTLEGVSDKAVVMICLSRYFDADRELKLFLKSLLCHLGLEDDDDIINKELDNFKLFSVQPGPQRMAGLQTIVSDWLQKWYQAMLNFASDCRNIISEEMHLLNSNFHKPSKNVLLCLEKVKDIFHLTVLNPVDLMQLYPLEKCSNSVLTYTNCLNFARYKLSLKKQRLHLSKEQTLSEETGAPKKTIVSLPKINPNKQCLVRLGESNADKIDVVKRKDFSLLNSMWSKTAIADPTQHAAMQPFYHYQIAVGGGFVPYMHLRMKPCLVNPFPRQEDILEWESVNSKSLFLSAKQSFIPQFSLPPEPF